MEVMDYFLLFELHFFIFFSDLLTDSFPVHILHIERNQE